MQERQVVNMSYFMFPMTILVTMFILSFWVLSKFEIGRLLIKSIIICLTIPVIYLVIEATLFYSVGRSLNPSVGIILGMLWPPKSYSHHLVEMDIKEGLHKYEREFICTHFGKYGIALYIDPSMLKESLRPATMSCGLSYDIVANDGTVCVTGFVDSKYGNYINVHSPYVIVGKFNVPKDVVRSKKYRLRVVINGNNDELIDEFPCKIITIIKLSDV
jgi:hypothetical protein